MISVKTILAASDFSAGSAAAFERAAALARDHGSVAEQVLRRAPCDVLTFRPSDFHFVLP